MKLRNMKISIILLMLIFLSVAYVCYAEDIYVGEATATEMSTYIPDVSETALLQSETIYDRLYNGMINLESKINISDFGYSCENIKALNDAIITTLRMHYELYYVSNVYGYSYELSGLILAISPQYINTNKGEIDETIRLMESKMEEILSYTDESMNDVQKLMAVYDQLILRSYYDSYFSQSTVKDLLLNGTVVCEGYARTLYALAEKMGIKSGFVHSDKLNHVWNAIYIDGAWYHADATWDDTNRVNDPCATHEYFLKSNDWFMNESENRHYDFILLENDSDKYDDAFWTNVKSPIITIAGQMYYISGTVANWGISVYNSFTEETTRINNLSEYWYCGPDKRAYWIGVYSGLAYKDGRLYFNTENNILSCKLDGTDIKQEFYFSDKNSSIYGCFEQDGVLYYAFNAKKDYPYTDSQKNCYAFPEMTNNKFALSSVFEKDGKRYISYDNYSGDNCTIMIFTKSGNRITSVDVISVSSGKQITETDISSDKYEIIVLNNGFMPLTDKLVC